MRMPFKLNRRFWPSVLTRWLPAAHDPRTLVDSRITGDAFTRAISVFRFGRTFKTTSRSRFPQTVKALSTVEFGKPPVVLDVGASDGITSLDIISSLPFEKYFVTDLNTEVLYEQRGRKGYFYGGAGKCILFASDTTVCYPADADAWFPFDRMAKRVFANAPDRKCKRRIELINPEVLATKGNVEVCSYDVFTDWTKQPVDLVIVANMLNRRYFSDEQLCDAVKKMMAALDYDGRIVIIESRAKERSTIFRVGRSGLSVEREIGEGAEIRSLMLREFAAAKAA